MAEISAERKELILKNANPCYDGGGDYQVCNPGGVPYRPEDVAAIQDAFFDGGGLEAVHLDAVIGTDDRISLNGCICVRSMGEVAARRFADCIDGFFSDRCVDEMIEGEGAEEKCDALFREVDALAEPRIPQEQKYVVAAFFGALFTFGPLLTLLNLIGSGPGKMWTLMGMTASLALEEQRIQEEQGRIQ